MVSLQWTTSDKEWNTDTCHNVDGSWKHHTKLKKQDIKDHLSYHEVYIKCPTLGQRYTERKYINVATGWRKERIGNYFWWVGCFLGGMIKMF